MNSSSGSVAITPSEFASPSLANGACEPSGVIGEIAVERRRQIEAEGWTPEHDDQHPSGMLLAAACCYAQRRMDEDRFGAVPSIAPAAWPWDRHWWKPTSRRRDLIKAAALIVAEIERLDRDARYQAEMGAALVGYFLPGEGEVAPEGASQHGDRLSAEAGSEAQASPATEQSSVHPHKGASS